MLPAVYVSHGSPMICFEEIPGRDFLKGLGRELGRPKSILAVSAHWETDAPMASTAKTPETIYDFYGFPQALYDLSYPAPGAPDLARRAVDLLGKAGFQAGTDPERGLDHGAWTPLLLMYPDADIPVTQLSIQFPLGPAHHVQVGRALAPLREEGVLILASGTATHNLRVMERGNHGHVADWVKDFDDWLVKTVESGDEAALIDYKRQAPNARLAHPRDEHFLPLYVAAGAGSKGRRIHSSFAHGTLSMAAFAFE